MTEIAVHPATSGPYPTAHRQARPDHLHGHIVQDPYRWLETPGSSDTRAWLAAQEGLAGHYLAHLPGTDALRRRIAELCGAGTVSTPIWRGARYFFSRRSTGQDHPVLYVATSSREPRDERILVDPNAIDPSGGTTLDAWCPDWQGRLLAYQLSTGGTEQAELHVMDVTARTDVDKPIDRCRYSNVAWLNDGTGFYYTRMNPLGQGRVYLHLIGTPAADDVLIFGQVRDGAGAAGARGRLSVAVSGDARWLIIGAVTGTAHGNALWLADLAACEAAAPVFRPVQRDLDARTRARVGRDGRWYLLTDWQAPRGRLAVSSLGAPGPAGWHDLLAEDPEAVLRDFAILDGEGGTAPVLLAVRTRHAVSEITVHDLATGARLAEVPLPGLGTIAALSERPEGGHEAWFAYTDISTPPTILRYDARQGSLSVWKRAPGTVTVPGVATRLVDCRSADGTVVRMLVTAATDQDSNPPAGPRPAILEGYGGFGLSLTPRYSPALLAWVEAGGVYAYASLRGGGEEGEDWHSAATRGRKQRTFDDFTAAAAGLIASGWTSPDRLAIRGGSNGGLLVAVALTQHPELFAAALCDSPITDMIRYERFGLGALWTEEYGSADDPADFATLMSYSPYHNVWPGTEYPAVLFLASDADTRVDPLHARKMCAALQHATTAPWPRRPILLRREAGTGHSARSTGRSVSAAAEALAFLAYHTNLNYPGGS